MRELYTIGYSKFSLDEFISVLRKTGINAVADVRSSPYSRFKPDFNRESLKAVLEANDIVYVFLGDECGARFEDQSVYRNGKVDFSLVKKHTMFLSCIERIVKGSDKFTLSLMCAEDDPITCHRDILICRNLRSETTEIRHIRYPNIIETNVESEKRLLSLHNFDQNELFADEHVLLEEAYDKQGHVIAYEGNQGEDSE